MDPLAGFWAANVHNLREIVVKVPKTLAFKHIDSKVLKIVGSAYCFERIDPNCNT